MKRRLSSFTFVVLATLGAGTAWASDPWMVKDIARDTGLNPAQVYMVLGENMAMAEHIYYMHPSRRGQVQQLVREYADAGLVMPRRLEMEQALRTLAMRR